MMDVYRDPFLGLRARLADLKAEIAQRTKQLTPQLRALLPAPLATELRRSEERNLKACTSGCAETLQTLSKLEANLLAHHTLLDQVLALGGILEASFMAVPHWAPEPIESRYASRQLLLGSDISMEMMQRADRFESRRETHPYESSQTPEERAAEEYLRYFEQRSDEAASCSESIVARSRGTFPERC
jgi:hypothetical protein